MVETNTQHQPNKDDTVVFLTRHGARIDSDDHRWLAKCSHNRANDPHLSPAGEIGAVELAQKMKELQTTEDGWKMLHIVSSPYIRCIETAHAVAQALNASIKVEPGIAEVNSSRHPNFLDAVELKQKFPSIDTSYIPALNREELSVEYSDGACAQRSANAARIVTERLEVEGRPILFVGHGASCLGIAGQFGQGGYVGYTSFSKFVREGDNWKCVTFGDVSHLSDRQTSLDSAW